MSQNCIHCVVKLRTGADLLCDDCRSEITLPKPEKSKANKIFCQHCQMLGTHKTSECPGVYQPQLDQLSNTVTALALAIDPTCKHGPETTKLVEYQKEVRKWTIHLVEGFNLHDPYGQSSAQLKSARMLHRLLDL
jgi:hypothetical protein